LRELIENTHYAATAAKIGQMLQTQDGVSIACDEIEQQLAKRDYLR
jgi:rhamnosyltransferase subunit B